MGRPRKTVKTVTEETTEPEGEELQVQELPEPEPDEETDVLGELVGLTGEGDITFTVNRTEGKPGQPKGYCRTYSRAELSLDAIREEFGGGKYQIIGRNSARQYVGSRRIEIVDLPKPKDATPGNSQLAEIAALINQGKPQMDIGAMMIAMMQSQAETFKAIMSKPAPVAPAGPTVMEIIAMIKAMKDDAPKDSSDPVKLLLQGLELGQKLGGGETGMMDLAAQGLGLLQPLIEKQASAPPAQPARPRIEARVTPIPAHAGPPPAAEPIPAHTGPAPTTQPLTGDPMLRQLQWLNAMLRVQLNNAARQKDPELYAEVMLDNLPDFITEDELMARLNQPDAIDQLAQLNPDVLKFRPWFEQFRQACIELLTPEADEPGEDEGTGEIEP